MVELSRWLFSWSLVWKIKAHIVDEYTRLFPPLDSSCDEFIRSASEVLTSMIQTINRQGDRNRRGTRRKGEKYQMAL